MKKKAVFFDLDGTLIDSAPDLAASLNHTLHSLGMPTYDLDTIRSWIGGGATLLLQRGLTGQMEPPPIDPKLFEKAKRIFFEHYGANLCNHTRAYPHAKEVLVYLRPRYRIGLVTNKPYAFVLPILKKLRLDYFDLVLGGDSLKAKKPSPEPLLHACQKLKVVPYEALMIGDSINDYLAAKEAGMDMIWVSHGYDSSKVEAQKIPSLATLKEIL